MTLENLSFPGIQRGRDVRQGAGSMLPLASPSEISMGLVVSPICSRAQRPERAGPPDGMSFICGSQVAVSWA